ncbi:hypothetical protein [Hymenobacter lucidus]|uniref:DUF4292 domain-containing protein n=1 Tax=Hymenobacter lucidus TaxID=2880930 RepID=A0ABS8AKX6_9BACT|nr:hypothetical protein [Hymenobacter lucidus]MCB2406853.1 hypothetical protein [Hymenobacter lucidus]
MLLTALRFPLVAALGLLLACSPATDEPQNTTLQTTTPTRTKGPFVGTLRFLERRAGLGRISTKYVTLTLDGHRIRRDVRTNSFADSTDRYGIIADLRTDSVTYYVQNQFRNVHCSLKRTDYLARVAANEPILTSLDLRPYGTVFEALPAETHALTQELKTGLTLGALVDCSAMLFFFPDRTRCEVIYSEQVRVAKPLIDLVEYNSPRVLPTLALAVHYTPPPLAQNAGLLDKARYRLRQEMYAGYDLDGLTETPPWSKAFDLPAGSSYAGTAEDLQEVERQSTNSSHHHHH